MNCRIAVLSVFAGVGIVSFSTGQGKPLMKSQVAPDTLISDRDRIEKLQLEVAELQKKLAALTQKYDSHTHQLHLEDAQVPGMIECRQAVVRWTPGGLDRGSVDRVCRQLGNDNISVLVAPGKESMVTGPPGP